MTKVPPRPRPRAQTRRIIRWVLGLQLALALILFGSDMMRVLPKIALPSTAPRLSEPVRPGDQIRRYAPTDLPFRPSLPGAPVPVAADMPSRLLFETVEWEGQAALSLTGTIAPGDAARFTDFLETAPLPRLILLNSPGGSVFDALAMGHRLRADGANTQLLAGAVCLSACPYLLAAGVERRVEDGAVIGVHQHFFGENAALPAFLAARDIQRGQGEVMAYLDAMGIDPRLMQPALITPPDEIYLLTAQELERYNLVTPED